MKIPWIPHGSCLPRAICSLAKECPTSQTWLQLSRARTGSYREAIPRLFLDFPAFPSCLWSLLRLLHFPRSRAASSTPNSCLQPCGIPAKEGSVGSQITWRCQGELPKESVGSQIPSPRHHRAAWTLGKIQSGNQTPQPISQLMSHSKLFPCFHGGTTTWGMTKAKNQGGSRSLPHSGWNS